MSLYSYDNITYLPPPPRTALSFGPERTRARLQDFETVEHLSQFVERLFVSDMSYLPSLRVHLIFSASFTCFLVLLAFFILCKRMYDQSFWIIRIIKRPTGNVLVPNSIICFALVEGLFGACFVTMMWYIYATFYTKTVPPRFHPAWFLLPWCPLIIGAVWAAWGLFFATPVRLQEEESRTGRLRYLSSHAWFTNSVGVVTPLLMCVTIVIPCIKANIIWNNAYHRYLAWEETYRPQTFFTQEMVQDAQKIWYMCLSSFYIVSATFIVWTLWALAVFVGYTWTATRLIRVIKTETSKMRDFGPRSGIAVVTRGGGGGEEARHNMSSIFSSKTLNTGSTKRVTGGVQSASQAVACLPLQPSLGDLTASQDAYKLSVQIAGMSADESAIDISRQTLSGSDATPLPFWRRIPVPNLILRSSGERMVVPRRQLRRDQISQLNKALTHILIQVCAISPACLSFMFVALFLAVCLYSSFEQPRNGATYIEVVIPVAVIAIDWIVCLFGGTTIIALAQRTYEHIFSHIQVNAQSHAVSMDADAPQGPNNRPEVLTLDILSEMDELDELDDAELTQQGTDIARPSSRLYSSPLKRQRSMYITSEHRPSMTPRFTPFSRGAPTARDSPEPVFTQYVRRQTGGATPQPFALEEESFVDYAIIDACRDARIGEGVQIERTIVVVHGNDNGTFDYDQN